MELWQLRYFTLVAELQSIARASTHLRIAAPAVSRAIKSLEDELRTRLFERDGRGMHLTLSGQTLLNRAVQLLRDAEIARQEVTAAGAHLAGEVAIGATPSIASIVGLGLITRCLELHRHIKPRVLEGYSAYLQNWVLTGAIDIAFVNGPVASSLSLSGRRLAVERLFAIGDPTQFGGYSSGIPLKALLKLPLFLPSASNAIRGLIDAAAGELDLPVQTRLEVDSVGLLKELAASGTATAVLPYGAVRREVEVGRLIAVPVIEPEIRSDLHVVYPTQSPPGPVANAMIGLAETVLAEFAASDERGVFIELAGSQASTARAGQS